MGPLKKIAALATEAVFPSLCVACRAATFGRGPDWWLCLKCRNGLVSNWATACPKCGKDAGFGGAKHRAHEPGTLENVSFLFRYEHPAVRALIHSLKYRYVTGIASTFAGFIQKERLNFLRAPVDVVVPLPIHRRKLRERGFNQSELVARAVSEAAGRPVLTDALAKVRPSRAQMKLKTPRERERNIRGVFRVASPEAVRDKNILLVDDVITTGATLEEAARVLRAAGAKRVFGFVLARD